MAEEKKTEVKEEVKTPTLEDLQKQIASLTESAKAKDAEIEKLKASVTNASADASSWKSKFRATQDEATRKEAERAEADEALKQELAALRTEKRISSYTAKLMEVGYDAQTATSMAMNLPEGISEDFFIQQKTFLESQKQKAKTELINNQPKLSSGETLAPSNDETEKYRKWFGL